MMQLLYWVGAVLWILLFLQVCINLYLSSNLSKLRSPEAKEWPSVSIIVPARDEAASIREAVTSFCCQEYPDFEVIVIDDKSVDQTPEILNELSEKYENLIHISGKELPEGWLGKPHALEQGREVARGDWLLFVDADVVYGPSLLKRSVAYVLKEEADMLFVVPNFTTGGPLEAALISSLYFVGAAVVPLFLVSRTRFKWACAGGGVFNMVRRDALEAAGAFESLRDAVVDDIGLGCRVKAAGYKLTGAAAGDLIKIRMYEGGLETIRGFSKNTFPGFRTMPWLLLIPFIMGPIISFLPYVGVVSGYQEGKIIIPAAISLLLMHAVFAILAGFFRQPWYLTFLNPLREAGWMWILIRSMFLYYYRGVEWRGRVYKL
jgi:cellulose synthase/poly-beta-1,6-N-acetylglucosamine synthase-like glycosyltransferase